MYSEFLLNVENVDIHTTNGRRCPLQSYWKMTPKDVSMLTAAERGILIYPSETWRMALAQLDHPIDLPP